MIYYVATSLAFQYIHIKQNVLDNIPVRWYRLTAQILLHI